MERAAGALFVPSGVEFRVISLGNFSVQRGVWDGLGSVEKGKRLRGETSGLESRGQVPLHSLQGQRPHPKIANRAILEWGTRTRHPGDIMRRI